MLGIASTGCISGACIYGHLLTAGSLALQVLPGSGKLFEHDGFLARASSDELASINMLGGFSELCRLLEERCAQAAACYCPASVA